MSGKSIDWKLIIYIGTILIAAVATFYGTTNNINVLRAESKLHVQDETIHTTYEIQYEQFIPRQEAELQYEKLVDRIENLNKEILEVKKDVRYIREHMN